MTKRLTAKILLLPVLFMLIFGTLFTVSLSSSVSAIKVCTKEDAAAETCIQRKIGENPDGTPIYAETEQDIEDASSPKSKCGSGGEPGKLCTLFDNYINPAIKFFSVGFGVIVTIMIIIGGIQYSAAGADPQAVANAKKKIYNALLALLAYGLLYAFLQFIMPGGVF